MALNSATGEISHNVVDISDLIQGTSNSVNDLVGQASMGFFGGAAGRGGINGFAGIKSEDIPTFENAVKTYKDGVQSIVNGWNSAAPMDEALKGAVANAFTHFIGSLKKLLDAYIGAIDVEIKEIQEVKANYLKTTSTLSRNIAEDSTGVASSAGKLNID